MKFVLLLHPVRWSLEIAMRALDESDLTIINSTVGSAGMGKLGM